MKFLFTSFFFLISQIAHATQIQDLAVGIEYSCALFKNGRVKCWGANNYGQLGLGDSKPRGQNIDDLKNLPFIDLGPEQKATQISVAFGTNCALMDNNKVKCWGRNDFGQVGIESKQQIGNFPGQMGSDLKSVDLGTDLKIKKIQSHPTANSFCALFENGSVKCWGYNFAGALGLGDQITRGDLTGTMGTNLPFLDFGTNKKVIDMSYGSVFGCVILDSNELKCWGYGGFGALGQQNLKNIGEGPGQMGDQLPAINLGQGKYALKVFVGGYHVCAELNDHAIKCWGYNNFGNLGLGHVTNIGEQANSMGDNLPELLASDIVSVRLFAIGGYHSCFAVGIIAAKCFGYNGSFGLGYGDQMTRGNTPDTTLDKIPYLDLGEGISIKKFYLGFQSTCAELNNGKIKCWGGNSNNILGLGVTSTSIQKPTDMMIGDEP